MNPRRSSPLLTLLRHRHRHRHHHLRRFSNAPNPPPPQSSLDAGHSIRKPISLWPGVYHSPVTNALWEARTRFFETSEEKASSKGEGVVGRRAPGDSRTSVEYSFGSDLVLREQYRNPWNEIRMGKVVEDLDALVGRSPIRIVLKKPIRVDTDLRIEGSVTWVGRSSMEIQLEVVQPTQDLSDSMALVANFTFVARDSETGKASPINQVQPETDQEKILWEEAEKRNKMRKMKRAEQKKMNDDEVASRIDKLLAEGRVFCDMPALADRDSILMKDTCLQNSLICQPQQRNIHGRIFGGFFMRKAFELAFSTAYAFAGGAPRFVEVDHVDFVKPVDMGNFLRFKSTVLYTEIADPTKPLINIEVVAHVTCPEERSSEVSNKFYFTFTVRPEALADRLKIRNVVPATEEEARRVIERMDAE